MMSNIYKSVIASCILAVNSLWCFGQADSKANGIVNISFLQVDLKAIDTQKGQFGLDYNLNLGYFFSKKPGQESEKQYKYYVYKGPFGNEILDSTLTQASLSFTSKGFVTPNSKSNANNSIINEFKLAVIPIIDLSRRRVLSRDLAAKRKQIASVPSKPRSIDEIVEGGLDASEVGRIQGIMNPFLDVLTSPLLVNINLQARHETTQDFRNFDVAFGANLSLTSTKLAQYLDYIFIPLRLSQTNNNRGALFASIGYDYVTAVNHTKLKDINSDLKDLNRLNFKAEWQTGIFTERTRIGFLYDSYYFLRPIDAISANNLAYNRFFMIKLDQFLNSSARGRLEGIVGNIFKDKNGKSRPVYKISLKYTQGQLPPNFESGFVLGAGFSIDI